MLEFVDGAEKSLKLTGKITIYRSAELRKLLMQILEATANKSGKWVLDLTQVESIDLAALQVFLALRSELRAVGAELMIAAPSEHLTKILETVGLGREFPEKASA